MHECATHTTQTPTTSPRITTLFQDWRNQLSWGRVCSAVSLVVAVVGQFRGIDSTHLTIWLGVAVGSYGTSKLTEIFTQGGVEAPTAPGAHGCDLGSSQARGPISADCVSSAEGLTSPGGRKDRGRHESQEGGQP